MSNEDFPATIPVSGATRLLTIVGHPVTQVRSPGLLNAALRRRGIDAALLPVDLEPEALPAFLISLRGWRNSPGCIVTVPHKIPAAALVDTCTPRAMALGAVNMTRRGSDGALHGDMVDGDGFVAALRGNGFDPRGQRVAVFGAGAVGRALLESLGAAGASALQWHDPDSGRLAELGRLAATLGLADRLRLGGDIDLSAIDLAVNASTTGMKGDPRMAFDPGGLPGHAFVADVVTDPADTPLLRAATDAGLRTQGGLAMAAAQIDIQLAFFGLDRA